MLPLVTMEDCRRNMVINIKRQKNNSGKGHAFNKSLVRGEHSREKVSTLMEHIGLKRSLSPYVLVCVPSMLRRMHCLSGWQ